jgi:hypothetical protein
MDPQADKKAAEEDKKPKESKQPEEGKKEKSVEEVLAEKDKQIAALQVSFIFLGVAPDESKPLFRSIETIQLLKKSNEC